LLLRKKLVNLTPPDVRCQILRLKCTKFDFRWNSAPDPAGGAYSAPPGPLAIFNGPTSKGRERERKRRGRKVEGKGGEGKGGKRRDQPPPPQKKLA